MSLAWSGYSFLGPAVDKLAPFGRWLAPAAERALWPERLGEVRRTEPADAWIHSASLGEAVAVGTLIRELRAVDPGARMHLTATTRTGRERLSGLNQPVSLAPLDSRRAVARFLERVRPARLLLLETELWPQWILATQAARIPTAVLSARLSPHSVSLYRWFGQPFRQLIAGLDAILCQSEADRERWLALGGRPDRTGVVGNLKNDGLPGPAPERGTARAALGFDPDLPLLVLGSLRPGEAEILARAWRALPPALRERWQVVAVPRHPGALSRLMSEAKRAGLAAAAGGASTSTPGGWHWDGRAGVLRDYYAAAEIAFVGGSLLPFGGHNPLEPAACGAAVLMGPHHDSQAPAVAALRDAGAIEVALPGAGLEGALHRLLEDGERRSALGRAGKDAASLLRGASRRAVERLVEWRLWPA